jgi:HK97 family phage major capsid protein
MSDIEELLKKHVGDVDAALQGFEGKVGSVQDLISALNARADTMEKKMNRPGFSIPGEPAIVTKLAFPADERKQMEDILRGKAMSIGSDPDGGYLVPEVMRTQIETLVMKQSPMRRVANVLDFTSGFTTIPVNKRGTTGGWVGENGTREETDTPDLGKLTPPGGTVYALPSATEEVVDDAVNNLEAFISENVIDCLAEKESQAFIDGDGLAKPSGFLSGPAPVSTADATRAFGTLQYIPTGSAATIGASNQIDALVAMIFAVKAGYRQAPGCAWLGSTDVIATYAKIKDGQGNPILIPSLQEGLPSMLLGYPVIEFEHMAAIGANAFPLAFGNWRRGYVIGDRTPLNVLRDPYTTKGRIKWYFRKRVHGMVLNSEAIKLLKVAAG